MDWACNWDGGYKECTQNSGGETPWKTRIRLRTKQALRERWK